MGALVTAGARLVTADGAWLIDDGGGTECCCQPPPEIPCCLPNETCLDLTLTECAAAGGTNESADCGDSCLGCPPNHCEEVQGSCPDGACSNCPDVMGVSFSISGTLSPCPGDPPGSCLYAFSAFGGGSATRYCGPFCCHWGHLFGEYNGEITLEITNPTYPACGGYAPGTYTDLPSQFSTTCHGHFSSASVYNVYLGQAEFFKPTVGGTSCVGGAMIWDPENWEHMCNASGSAVSGCC